MFRASKLLRLSLVACFATVSAMQTASADPVYADKNRIVSLGGSITEIIYDLGQLDRLVARDTTSNYPQAVLELPDVGYVRRLSPEGVLSVNPDLIIAIEGSGPKEAVDLLAEANIPFVTIPNEFTRQGVVAKIKAVADTLGVPEKGAKMAAELDVALKDAEETSNKVDNKKRVMFILTARNDRFLISGTNTGADSIIRMAGGINAVTEFEGYKPMTDEAMSAAAPDVILLMRRTGPMQISDEDLSNHPAIAITPAGQAQNFVRMDGMFLLGFGPRTAKAIVELHKQLYPGQG
ncbi:MAG: hemin ABC transporter substrate-binding protein [Rhodobacterales bacterium]|nr:MAG: hemin ABC transporter substrate-binding protein [Rhodobacterales bacterium]